jgi:glycosyltransferase involved in cell wall biosynthesis
MIVKNESKIIERLLKSVLPIIDSYCICDTGSTDNTIEIIKTFFANHNITGKIVQEQFINFCHNRNFALNSCIGMSDFVLLLDADMILNIYSFDKNILTNYDSCYILQGTDNFYYKNMRIIRNNGAYSYSGITHEYINTPPSNRLLQIDKNALFIHDIGDGGSKHDKFERDIKLLLEGIKEDCNNVRYHFYLANSYHDSNQLDKAIEMYEKRITLNGWDQEVWYSYYKIGICYKKKGKMPEAIYAWLNAYEYMPTRIENLYEIINHYRIIGKCKLAKQFYDLAIDVLSKKYDKNNFLFLHNDVYTYKIYYEYTIIANYVGIKNINDEIIKVFNNSSDEKINNILLSNMKFYKNILTPINVITNDIYENKQNIKLLDTKLLPKIFQLCSSSTSGFTYNSESESEIWFVKQIVSNDHNYHMLCVFNTSMVLLRYSAPFKFIGEPIEDCIGIVVEEFNVSIKYISLNKTSIGVYDKKYIDSILKYKSSIINNPL